MEGHQKKHVLCLGLDHRLLWQLTRTLAHLEDQITIDCVKDPSSAKEICDREVVHVIVVDGWEQALQAAHHLAGDQAFEGKPWKWIILVEALPVEGLPSGRLSPSALFLEKPFNPKDFPSFLWGVFEDKGMREEEEAPEPVQEEISLPLVPGETYQEPVAPLPVGEGAEAEAGAEIHRVEEVPEPVEPTDFYHHLDQGFACLSGRDWKGAKEHWAEALRIRPDDQRLSANLRRLQRMMEERGGPE